MFLFFCNLTEVTSYSNLNQIKGLKYCLHLLCVTKYFMDLCSNCSEGTNASELLPLPLKYSKAYKPYTSFAQH